MMMIINPASKQIRICHDVLDWVFSAFLDSRSCENDNLEVFTCRSNKLPLGIDDYVKTMSKNIIAVAAVSNPGTTAFLINCGNRLFFMWSLPDMKRQGKPHARAQSA